MSSLVLLVAVATLGERLRMVLLFWSDQLQGRLTLVESVWFIEHVLVGLAAFYVASAIRAFLLQRRPWRTTAVNAATFVFFFGAYLFLARGYWRLLVVAPLLIAHLAMLMWMIFSDLRQLWQSCSGAAGPCPPGR